MGIARAIQSQGIQQVKRTGFVVAIGIGELQRLNYKAARGPTSGSLSESRGESVSQR